MQNKGAIRLFTILLTLSCIYYLTFTYVARNVENDAKVFADTYVGRADVQEMAAKFSNGDSGKQASFIDSLRVAKEDSYLDSIKKKEVYNILITSFTYEKVKQKEINLGLDLRGGMNVTLEVSVADIIRGLSNNNPDVTFNQAIVDAQKQQSSSGKDFVALFGENYKRLNPNGKLASHFQTIELKGKIDFNTKDEDMLKFISARVDEAVNTTTKTLFARIDKFGVVQPNIQKLQTSGRILVELPGVKDKERVRKLLQGTANLEFWETYENSEVYPMLNEANKRILAMQEASVSDSTKKDSTQVAGVKAEAKDSATAKVDSSKTKDLASQLSKSNSDTSKNKLAANDTSMVKFKKENPLFSLLRPAIYQDQKGQYNYMPGAVVGYANISDTGKVNAMLYNKKVRNAFPAKLRFAWGIKPPTKDGEQLELFVLKTTTSNGSPALSGDIIAEARKVFDQRTGGNPQISMNMTPEAAQIWRRVTKDASSAEPKRCIAIVLDNSVYSAPRVQGEIPGGQSQITGNFSNEDADDLVTILSAGKFPAPARIVQETVVGPTLGQEAITSGMLSFAIALGLVLLFMGFYYNKAGWVADIALIANMFFVMGVLASLGAVLTLPGIAGMVLTIGMSVDANILIFERVREEMASGKGVALAIKDGFRNAMSSIIDSNVTTLLLGIILYVFGTGPIQGFATTLIIGILSSLFSAIFITRMIFEGMMKRGGEISFFTAATKSMFKNINIDFVGKRKLYYLFSGIIIVAGIISFTQKGFNLGVDFKGGRTYVVRFDKAQNAGEVKKALDQSFETATEVKTYGGDNQLRITTSYLIGDDSPEVQAQVDDRLQKGLNQFQSKWEVMSQEKVGETVSRDIKSKAIWAILFSCLVMFVYIFIRFKRWQYGLGAVAALFHDVAVVLSCYTIFNGVLPFALEIDQAFIAAILTVMGYSMTDTVVVFDRIREYLAAKGKSDLDAHERHGIINYALNSTLSRTINTSLTIFFVLLAIFIFGGEVIKGFSFSLLIGIVIGTYSSICIATPIVIDFDKKGSGTANTNAKKAEKVTV